MPLRPSRQLVLFVAIGAINTILYFIMYNLLRLLFGPLVSNSVAVAISIAFSFFANRSITFRGSPERPLVGQLVEFSLLFLLTLAVSSAALAVLLASTEDPGRLAENVVLIVVSGSLVILRYRLMSRFVFGDRSLLFSRLMPGGKPREG